MFLPTLSTCRMSFRTYLFDVLPIVKQDPRYLGFVIYLLFGDYYDKDNGGQLIPTEILATIDGKRRQYKNHRYSGEAFLEEIRAHVLPNLRWSVWEYDQAGGSGKARTILQDGLPAALVARAHDERNVFTRSDNRVVLVNGKIYNRSNQAQRRADEQREALNRNTMIKIPEVYDLLTYMNTRKGNLFTSLRGYAPLAHTIITAIEKPTHWDTEVFRKSQRNTLRSFQEQPQPFYGISSSGHSTRIFPLGGGLLNLKSTARKAMTRAAGWLECDLKSAQLAIIAKDWELPVVYTYLREGKDIWVDLLVYAGLPYTDTNKAHLKDMLYALIYGAAAAWVQGMITQRFDDAAVGKLIRSHPIMAALIERREVMKNHVIACDGMQDCFGRWLALTDMEGDIDTRAFCILAICAQARELQLLAPVICEAMRVDLTDRAWQIVLFQHDGFTVAVRDLRANRVKKLAQDLEALVQAKADELNIPTRLVCDID